MPGKTKTKKRAPKAEGRENLYCRAADLSNEASVESFFVLRLLQDLGYEDREILTKAAIEELKVPMGRRKEPYRPDFILKCKRKPRWLIDAKAPGENVDDFTQQCASYSLLINRKYKDRPLRFYMLTNGFVTRVYTWDQEEPVLSLRFADFAKRNTKYKSLVELLSADAAREGWPDPTEDDDGAILLDRPEMDVVKKAFIACHRIIWKAEKMSPQAAFLEFAKLMFVKLWEDRRLRNDASMLARISRGDPLPSDAVRFSTAWIARHEADVPSPIDSILFAQLRESLEEEIAQKKRKRIFPATEKLNLGPGTIKRVVEKLEGFYLFGIDEDLNGRMFEAFLTATMRGQDLGQYFTPRSIVKLMTRLGKPIASTAKVERVIDGCCGTGGFLIEALTEMRKQIYENTSLTKREQNKLLDEVANDAIFGVDAGRDPPLSRIARINMYLHGDGGSRIYTADGLRKSPLHSGADPLEVREEIAEFREIAARTEFDLVLTNPPFSMDYSASVPEEHEVIEDYELIEWDDKPRTTLRSAVLFLERYYYMLAPGGRLLIVLDDSVLSGAKSDFVRDYIRERFIIRAVISLHGDAFQRAGARAKTSVLYLTKPAEDDEEQSAAFVYESRYIGLDDVVPRTRPSVAAEARRQAVSEIEEILASFDEYLTGNDGPWLVEADKLLGRLDAKFLRPWSVSALKPAWKKIGAKSVKLGSLVEPVETQVTLSDDKRYQFIRIAYAGYAEDGEESLGKEVGYSKVYKAQADDIVISNINAVHGAVAVLPERLEDHLISNEYTILRLKPGAEVDCYYLWSVLRSAGVVAEWLSQASGVGRHRVGWEMLKDQEIPLLDDDQQQRISDMYRRADEMREEIEKLQINAADALKPLQLDGEAARDRLARAKPPK